MVTFHIISIFPEVFEKYLNASMLWRAQKEKRAQFFLYNPRTYTKDKHRKVDHRPYGGGPGMVMTVQPILAAVEAVMKQIKKKAKKSGSGKRTRGVAKSKYLILLTSPRGMQLTNEYARSAAKAYTDIILICGHYEGIDARIKKILSAKNFGRNVSVKELSIGPYVLTGGELPAMVMIDATVRQIPGVLGNERSLEECRVSASEMYTRPEVFTYAKKTYRVPKILLTGHHEKIEEWKRKKGTRNSFKR